MSQLIISVSGLRGIVGETLTPEVAVRYTAAFAERIATRPRRCHAGRPAHGTVAGGRSTVGTLSHGTRLSRCGHRRYAYHGVLVRQLKAAGGIQISASHNPPEYNGIKLFDGAGRVMPAVAGQKVIDRYPRGQTSLEIVRRTWQVRVDRRHDVGPP